MAITLNKFATQCVDVAVSSGKITPQSSVQTLLYCISRDWRKLCAASNLRDESEWSDRERAAAEVVITTLTYLQRSGCSNIEQLLKDALEQQARQK